MDPAKEGLSLPGWDESYSREELRALLARYENTVVRTIQNSMDISRKYFGKTLILVILVAAEVLIFQYNSTMIFLGILFGPGFIIYTVAAVSKRVFLQIERVNREGE